MTSDPMDHDALLGRAESVVQQALSRGADQAEVHWSRGVELSLDIENDALQNSGRSRSEGGAVRLIKDGRIGFAYFVREDKAAAAIDEALQLSRLAPKKGMMLPAGSDPPRLGRRFDAGLAALDVEDALDLAKQMLDARKAHAADMHLAGGGVHVGWGLEVLANSEGVACADRTTGAGVGANLVMQEGESAITAWDSESTHVTWPDSAGLLERVAADIRSLKAPQPAKDGPASVVFRPEAVTELITGLVLSAVHGDDAMRGKTVWSDRLGDDVAASSLSIVDDPLREGAVGSVPFDGDGLPAQRLPIIDDGVLSHFLFDTRDGHEHGQPSTHSAVRGSFKSPPGVGVHHLVIEGSGAVSDDRLVGGVDHGYLVESVLGAHTANATTGDFSVTAPNVWRIEDGEVAGASTQIAISGNLPDLLHRLDGIGREPKKMDGAWVPMLRFQDVHVST